MMHPCYSMRVIARSSYFNFCSRTLTVQATSAFHRLICRKVVIQHSPTYSCNPQSKTFFNIQRLLLSTSHTHYNKESNEKNNVDLDEKPVSLRNRLIFVAIVAVLGGTAFYFADRKKTTEKLEKREVELSKVDIGAEDYELTDNTGKRVTKQTFLGKWLLLYFGFTHCPDICPEELDRMSEIVDIIDNDKSIPDIQPLFISVDPARDTPEAITTYLSDFHKKFIGLTGTSDEVKQATKAFRVYYQAGPKDDDNDYIVDHTIVMYLMNPKGLFVDYYGSRSVPIDKIVSGIKKNMLNYKRLHG